MTMISTIKKDFKDGIRNYRFLIIFAGFMFFALLTPVMNKFLLPGLLKSQFPGMGEEALQSMLVSTQAENIRGYMGDIFEIGLIIVAFTLCGVIAAEIKEYTLIIPVCSGKKYGETVVSKIVVFGTALVVIPLVSIFSNYLYSGVLFGFDLKGVIPVITAGLLQGLYMIFVLTLLVLIGTFLRSQIVVGLITLTIAYGTRVIANMLDIDKFLPSGLLTQGLALADGPDVSVYMTVAITVGLSVLFSTAAVFKLRNTDLTRR